MAYLSSKRYYDLLQCHDDFIYPPGPPHDFQHGFVVSDDRGASENRLQKPGWIGVMFLEHCHCIGWQCLDQEALKQL